MDRRSLKLRNDSGKGYILDVDIGYPKIYMIIIKIYHLPPKEQNISLH